MFKRHFLIGGVAACSIGAGLLAGFAFAPRLSPRSMTVPLMWPILSEVPTGACQSHGECIASAETGKPTVANNLSLLFTGDLMFDRLVATRMQKAKDETYPFAKIRNTDNPTFWDQDVVIGNLEGPVTATRQSPEKSIDFAFATTTPQLLLAMGFDAVSQANNHSLDQGRKGAEESREALSEAGLAVFGDQVHDGADSALTVIERHGQKLALLGFNITDNELDTASATQAILTAKAQANHVVVFMHWGLEYHDTPTKSQTELAHWFIDQGVDAVIGAHPHWMQSVEVYRGRPIAYSLGNFIFDQDWSSETQFGLVVRLVLRDAGSDLQLFPIKIFKSQPELLTGDERQARLDQLAKISDPVLLDEIKQGELKIERKP